MENSTNQNIRPSDTGHTQYSSSPDSWNGEPFTGAGDIAELKRQLEELTLRKTQLIHNADRMEQLLKEQIRKKRTSRLIHWGAEFERQLGIYASEEKNRIANVTQKQQQEVMRQLFEHEATRRRILEIIHTTR